MAVVIRMQRAGGRNYPFFRVVVADSRRARDGRFLEKVGWYNPIAQPAQIELDHERIQFWVERGAQPSESVHALLKHQVKQNPELAHSPVTPTQPADLPAVQAAAARKQEAALAHPQPEAAAPERVAEPSGEAGGAEPSGEAPAAEPSGEAPAAPGGGEEGEKPASGE